ncbi:MAG: PLD nuclease N-terminal domain-containing protein [Desulfobacterales bacterium]
MGVEVGGIFGLLILVADIWAIVSTFQSQASTGKKVIWIVLVLILPVIGFVVWLLAGPKSGKAS